MYSREEVKELKKRFWINFSDYCDMLPEMQHRKTKFMLYNTRLKGVAFMFDAGRDGAYVILEINHPNRDRRDELYTHFKNYRVVLESEFGEALIWERNYVRPEGKQVDRIYSYCSGLDIHRQEHWPDFYDFMAQRMLRLERAFLTVKDALE